jgi:hypothetical protein
MLDSLTFASNPSWLFFGDFFAGLEGTLFGDCAFLSSALEVDMTESPSAACSITEGFSVFSYLVSFEESGEASLVVASSFLSVLSGWCSFLGFSISTVNSLIIAKPEKTKKLDTG